MFSPKNISILATLLIIVGLVGSLATYRLIPKQETMTEEISHTDFTNVEIAANNGKVSITQTSEQKSRIEITGYNLEKSFSSTMENETLFIKYKETTKKFFNFGFGQKTVKIHVYVPEENYHSVIVEANNGKVDLSNLTTNQMDITANNGSLSLRNSHADQLEMNAKNGKVNVDQLTAKTVKIQTDNGRMNVEDVKADSFDLLSKNGKIELTEVIGVIKAKANNGKILLTNKQLESALDFVTKNGKIEIKTTEEPTNVEISAQAKNGRITIFNEDRSHATFGKGENKINLQSHNGKIIVEN